MRLIAQADVQTTGINYAQAIQTGHGHSLSADEPESAGGRNAGATPYELLLASLGACTVMTLQMYAERKQWDLGRLRVQLSLSKDSDKNTHIERVLDTDADLSDEQWARLLDIASKTPVTLTLSQGAQIASRRG